MAHFKAPRTVVFGPLPKTSTGKIQKFVLREQAKNLIAPRNSSNLHSLEGRVALVTGASSGLGAHFAQVLAKAGAKVAIAARREAKLVDLAEQIQKSGGRASAGRHGRHVTPRASTTPSPKSRPNSDRSPLLSTMRASS